METTIFSIISPVRTHKPSADDNIQVIDLKHVDIWTGEITTTRNIPAGTAKPTDIRRIVQTEDVLVSIIRPYIREIVLIPETLNGYYAGGSFVVLRPQKKVINPTYLYYLCLSDIVTDQLLANMKGATRPRVDGNIINNVIIPVPSMDKQLSIVSEIDNLLEDWHNIVFHYKKILNNKLFSKNTQEHIRKLRFICINQGLFQNL